MAVSGSETTRIGASLSGVGKRLSISAKAAAGAPTGRIMSSMAASGGLAGHGGIAGPGGGLAA